jgi:putative Ca2+/H+ antiporter (TMEM165/GDT1 family)
MLIKLFTIFITIFIAELGDKTQIATLLLASDKNNNAILVFIFASLALVTSSLMAAALGCFGAKYLTAIPLELIAGIGFIILGIMSVSEYFRG